MKKYKKIIIVLAVLIAVVAVIILSLNFSPKSTVEKEYSYTTITTDMQNKNTIVGRLDRNAAYVFNKDTGEMTIKCKGNLLTHFAWGSIKGYDDSDCDSVTFEQEDYQEPLAIKNITSLVFADGVTLIGENPVRFFKDIKTVTFPLSTKRILDNCFPDYMKLDKVVYDGTEAEWNKIIIGDKNNDALLNCKNIVFNNKSSDDADFEQYRYRSVKYKGGKTKATVDYFTGELKVEGKGVLSDVHVSSNDESLPDSVLKDLSDVPLFSSDITTFPIINTLIVEDGITVITAEKFESSYLKKVYLPKSVIMIQKNAFNHNKGLTDVYYAGSKKQWESVKISNGNDDLKKAKIHYNTEY